MLQNILFEIARERELKKQMNGWRGRKERGVSL